MAKRECKHPMRMRMCNSFSGFSYCLSCKTVLDQGDGGEHQ